MKKIACILLLISIVVLSLTSCGDIVGSMFGIGDNSSNSNSDSSGGNSSSGNNTAPEKEYVTLTILGGENELTAQIQVGTKPKINIPIKHQHIFTGLYAQANGGTKYFDEDGEATMVWQNNFPTTLYAQFKNIVGLKHTSVIKYDEDPHYIDYMYDQFKFDISNEFKKALNSNSSLNVKVTVYYSTTGVTTAHTVNTRISSTRNDEGEIKTETFTFNYSTFTQRSMSVSCSAKQILKNNGLYFAIQKSPNSNFMNPSCSIKVKNVYCVMEIEG